MNNIFDSHAHYTQPAFDGDRHELLSTLPSKGVSGVMLAATDPEDSFSSLALAERYDYIYSSAGVHPGSIFSVESNWIDKIVEISLNPKVKAIGEIGLDYYYDNTDKELQKKFFEAQLILASDLNMPVIIHLRDAFEDTLNLLKKYRPFGVVHCFSGSAEIASEIISLGMYIGFTGVLTFKNAKKPLLALEKVPIDKLLLETDCPYMAPEPLRGKRSDSSMIIYTAEAAARVKKVNTQKILNETYKNACKLYNI